MTVDAGLRFYYMTPTQSDGDEVAAFEPGQWSGAQAPRLYTPVSTPQGRMALNPLTGQILPAVYIGRLVPGSGNFNNGMQVYDGTPHTDSPFRVAPRLSFAWDVTGDGRTAVRGGAGVFYDRYADDIILDLIELPPVLNTYRTNYTTVNELLGSPLTATPSAVRRVEPFKPPVVYNWSFGVQRDVGFNLIADAAYVGNAARNQQVTVDINGRPYGYAYQPASLDSTVVVGGQAQPFADDFLRPYQGFGRIQERRFVGVADYHALQFSVNRRRSSDGLALGVAYTYQLSNKTLGAIDPFVEDNRARNYTSSGRRPHVLGTQLLVRRARPEPAVEQPPDQGSLRQLAVFRRHNLDDGHLRRVHLQLRERAHWSAERHGRHQRRRDHWRSRRRRRQPSGASPAIRTCREASARSSGSSGPSASPPPTDQFRLGTALNDEYLGPGYVNWDFSVFKNVPIGGTRQLQFRVELYNAFNSDQWTAANTNATFDYTTGALTNANVFGRLTNNTLSARRIQLGARFTF